MAHEIRDKNIFSLARQSAQEIGYKTLGAYALLAVFAVIITVTFVLSQQRQNLIQSAAYDASTKTFTETFDGDPASPQRFSSPNWHFTRDIAHNQKFQVGPDPMDAQHGADCGPPPASHRISGWDDLVYICKNHVMTAINGNDSYGAVYLSPNAILDWGNGPATLTWDVSTLQMSGRDWIDVWITNPDDFLSLPGEEWFPAYQGTPRNSITARYGVNAGNPEWHAVMSSNFNQLDVGVLFTGIQQTSPMVRSPFQITISSNSIKMTSLSTGATMTKNINVPFTKGIVQFGHHSYNPEKDGAGDPATWHWDNVAMSPSTPFSYISVSPRRVPSQWTDVLNGKITTLSFASPAPANTKLAFGAVCEVHLNWGSGFSKANYQPSSVGHRAETASSYYVNVPAGAISVQMKFAGDDWYAGHPCMLEDPVLMVMGSQPQSTPTSVVNTPTQVPPTPTNVQNSPTPLPTVTNTPTPTKTPTPTSLPTATNTPVPLPTATNTPIPLPSATPTKTPAQKADINNSGTVDIQDLSYLLSKWRTSDVLADINGDGNVTILDLSILLSHYGT
jgi:hypothetical protein